MTKVARSGSFRFDCDSPPGVHAHRFLKTRLAKVRESSASAYLDSLEGAAELIRIKSRRVRCANVRDALLLPSGCMIRLPKILICAFAACLTQTALAQSDAERGRAEFLSSCAVCHGAEATGEGPLRAFLLKPPSDLTTLARRNGGEFPVGQVMDMIDGRAAVQIGSHGTREMPVWGQVYAEHARQDDGRAKLHPEWTVRARITALTQYLARLQVR